MVKLPILEPKGSLRKDGSRDYVHPADVSGRFTRLRYILFTVLIGWLLVLPWLKVAGRPALQLDVDHRRFYFFGFTANAQDAWLTFFLLTGVGFLLIFATAALGRVWCGYACPQTVFLEGAYRRIERWIEGPRPARLKLNAGPWTKTKLGKKVAKHSIFIAISLVIGHACLAYFTTVPSLFKMVQSPPSAHLEAFAWTMGISALAYGNFAWFREQFCLIVCPYGRLQSVLTDDDSLVIGYDEKRGEPRGKAGSQGAGDCVDCHRCVVVCPTGIDIRHGLQIECIGCAACIDACDEIMFKLDRPKGLIRYDSLNGLLGKARKFLRPRMWVYAGFGLVGLVVFGTALRGRTDFEANLLRMKGAPFVVSDGTVRNSLEVHLVSKRGEKTSFHLEGDTAGGLEYVMPISRLSLEPMGSQLLPVFVSRPSSVTGPATVRVLVRNADGTEPPHVLEIPFVGPGQ